MSLLWSNVRKRYGRPLVHLTARLVSLKRIHTVWFAAVAVLCLLCPPLWCLFLLCLWASGDEGGDMDMGLSL